MISQHPHRSRLCTPASPRLVVITRHKFTPTTRLEHLLLLLPILLIPLESYLPAVRGFSPMFFLFVISSIYILTQRFGSIIHVWNHQVFLTCYFLIFVSIVLETSSPFARYTDISSTALVFCGAISTATLCRDIRALRVCIVGYILVALWVSLYLFLFMYGTLQGATATDFNEASRIRSEIEDPLGANLNVYPFFIAQGVAAAIAIALTSGSVFVRYSLFGIIALGFIASFLPVSRGGTAAVLLTCMAVVLAYVWADRGASFPRFIRIMAVILGLGMCMLLWVPHAVFARFVLPSSESRYEDAPDPRARMINTALAHLPEYGLVGVGAGNFWSSWGQRSGFPSSRNGVLGVHNCFVQFTIFWGLPGLLSLISLVYFAYKCLPNKCGNNPLSLAVLGIAVPLFVFLLVTHNLNSKIFSLGLGILVGTQCWIWPAGKTQRLSGNSFAPLPRDHAASLR
jgi:hypothetical protein